MKLHNTLSRKTEDFKSIRPNEVSVYTCGPTVYDHVHIGNLRTYIFEDLLRRTLKAVGYNVSHVMNITDVDDKTIKRSQEKYPGQEPQSALKRLTAEYEKLFQDDSTKVGIELSDSKIIKATDHISDMQALIKQIPTKYVGDDGVYFDIEDYKDYGTLVKLDRSHTHHRIDNDEYDKDHVADFVLWKIKAEGEPSWDFDIDGQNMQGRPGWHIECSAMSVKYLGQPFDIHTGGVDLIFPHHENEIAQSRSALGKPLANYFVHAEHLLVDGRKMSKSLNNFYILDDILARGFDPLAFRLLVLQAHYRRKLNFTWEALDAAQTFLRSLQAWADLKFQTNAYKKSPLKVDYKAVIQKIKHHLASDLNSAEALGTLSELTAQADEQGIDANTFQTMLEELDALFGLALSQRSDITKEIKDLIQTREQARQNQDWPKSDELRGKLLQLKIELNDTPHGPIWRRI